MSFNANAASTSGFISPMDDPAFSVTPTAGKPFSNPIQSGPAQLLAEEDDDDDLGLGNSSLRPKQTEKLKPTASGGWLNISRLWKRNETTPSAVKANLGEQSSFYYDKELKRWVNKNGAAEAAKPAQPPPPPRAQTASPGRSHAPLPAGTAPPPRPPMRVRSNLVPTEAGSFSAPPTPASATIPDSATGPPPSTGRASRQGKRAVRSRYVDIFQQEATGTPS
ncbi:hypothetical protein A0H81_04206 [Grifola frondosa]|uniref:COPII coat assembly protein SEC16 n=1 Tax=Grifola frondosa TaxID=5627 RepID=A0A1C7ME79_GRIFR|nr:hypothetical protein A0H81_04206 [Grifola frondosa]